jgi:hypothetical protein
MLLSLPHALSRLLFGMCLLYASAGQAQVETVDLFRPSNCS